MEFLKLNETPLRTSRNFKINNIKLEGLKFPENVPAFNGLKIVGECSANERADICRPTYGLGDMAYENILRNANSNIKISGKDIKLFYDFDDNNLNLINYIEIDATEDTNVIIRYNSATNHPCFANSIIKLNAEKEVNISIAVINMLNEYSNCFLSVENDLAENSNLQYTMIDLGAKNSVQNYYSKIAGDYAQNDIQSIYLGSENQIKDINYIAELYGKKSIVNINVQGALNDSAKKNFKGTIDFKKGCKKAKGDENEYCMLLSDKAKSIALPMLLCTEDDVEGNHATASGKLDDKELFYIMSRGFDKKEATKLIVKARLNNILDRINDEKVRDEVIEEIDRRLD